MTTEKLTKLYEHPMFHGMKTEAEAYDICKAEIEQFGKPGDGINIRHNSKYITLLGSESE